MSVALSAAPHQTEGLQRPYPKYRDTGLDWLPRLPEHWSIEKLKFISQVQFSNVDKKSEDDELPVRLCNYVDVYYHDRITADIEFMDATAEPREIEKFQLRRGDVLVTKDSEEPNDICVPAVVSDELPGVLCGYHLAQVRPDGERAWGDYIMRAFASSGLRDQFRRRANGVTRFGLSQDAICGALFPVPPLPEQRAIAAWLDDRTKRIDELVAAKRRLIDLLAEQRTALITKAVTKGLNPDAPMKPSGIDWIGDVPTHWRVERIASLFREVSEPGLEDLPILSVSIHTGVSDSEIAEEDMDRKVLRSEDRTKYARVAPGDLVYNMMRAWQGGFGAVKVPGMVSPAYVVARPRTRLVTEYFEHLLRTPNGTQEMRRFSYGVADFRWRLYWEAFRVIRVSVPPIEEQVKIGEFIRDIWERVDRLTDVATKAIEHLEEYRQSLITAAVTGKIDVRQGAGT
jgi:type I restriction enzyme S subunit